MSRCTFRLPRRTQAAVVPNRASKSYLQASIAGLRRVARDKVHDFPVLGAELMFSGQTAEFGKPAESPFHDPAPGQDDKAMLLRFAAFGDRQLQVTAGKQCPGPVHQVSGGAPIGKMRHSQSVAGGCRKSPVGIPSSKFQILSSTRRRRIANSGEWRDGAGATVRR